MFPFAVVIAAIDDRAAQSPTRSLDRALIDAQLILILFSITKKTAMHLFSGQRPGGVQHQTTVPWRTTIFY
ncbi:MAG: hypothetical protein P8X96_09980 [Desulfobacteraceae bacterium]